MYNAFVQKASKTKEPDRFCGKAGCISIDKKSFIAELEKLLGFMSPWDRQAVIRRYERRIEEADDPEQLLEMFGTATKVAVMLADGYVSSPPPEHVPEITVVRPDTEDQMAFDDFVPEEPAPQSEEPMQQTGGSLPALFWVFAIVIGLPVALLLICPGLPFLAAGVSIAAGAVYTLLLTVGGFKLMSDVMLLAGGALILAALGLLLAWLGLWISISLVRLWVGGALVGLARRLRRGKGAQA